MAVLPFIGPTYQDQSVTADAERCVNWYVELMESATSATKALLLPRPGVATFCTLPTAPVRGELSMAGRYFVVGGNVLYEITLDDEADWPDAETPSGTAVSRGTVATDQYGATISSNGDAGGQLFVTSGGLGYIYDLTANTLTFVVTGADMGGFLGGYFIRLDRDTSTFALSELEDGLTWNAGFEANRSLAADPWVSMAVIHNELWLLGEQTSEIWQNIGAGSFPFAPIQGAFLEWGCGAPFSVARLGGSLCWLASNDQGRYTVVRASGYAPQRVSTHAVEFALQQQADLSDADAFAYQDQGHEFYVLNVPALNQTWVYDIVSGLWHQRDYWNVATGLSEMARPRVHSVAFGYALVGDRVTGDILRQDVRLTTDTGGVPIRRVRRAPTLTDEQKWARYRMVQLTLDVGLGVLRSSRYYAVIYASGATNYFRLGETQPAIATVFADSLGAGELFSLGATTPTVGETGLVGDSNLAAGFDGLGMVSTFTGVSASTTTFSLEMSIRPDSSAVGISAARGLVSGFTGGGLVYNKTTGLIGYDIAGTPTYFTGTLTSGSVYHLILSVTAGVGTLYLNGASAGTVSGIPSMTPFYLGRNPAHGYFKGVIDEIVYTPGVALTAVQALAHYDATGPVSGEPQVMLRWSNDNGRTWSPEQWRSAGREGAYATRCVWRQLGRARTRIFEVAVTDGTPWRLVEFLGTIERGTGA